MSFNIDNWAVNHEITAGANGSCSDWKNSENRNYNVVKLGIAPVASARGDWMLNSWFTGTKSSLEDYDGRPGDGENRRYDYYVCGNSELRLAEPFSNQPVEEPFVDENYVLIYNGEIYNYRELRKDLEQAGVRFRTQGDTEVLLEALIHWGDEALTRLDGMFAFAACDLHQGRLLLAVDRMRYKCFH